MDYKDDDIFKDRLEKIDDINKEVENSNLEKTKYIPTDEVRLRDEENSDKYAIDETQKIDKLVNNNEEKLLEKQAFFYNTKEQEMPKSKKNNKTKTKRDLKKKNKKQGGALKVFGRILLVLIVLAILAGIGIIMGYMFGAFGSDLNLKKEDFLINKENTMVFDKDGELVAVIADSEKRQTKTLSEMPKALPKAYIAIEDQRFYKHKGVDYKRTIGATAQYILRRGSSSYGASTLTQQLIKNVTEDNQRSWKRKVREITRALALEKMLTKEQILELYLNIIFVGGPDIHGVSLAADYYFAKEVKDLTVAQCAFLAGINHMPNLYNPYNEPEPINFLSKKEIKEIENDSKLSEKQKQDKISKICKEKRDEEIKNRTTVVLNKMKELGPEFITEEEYNKSIEEVNKGFKFKQGKKAKSTVKYSYVTDAAIEEMLNIIMKDKGISRELATIQLYSGGYKIYTTQISKYQKIVEKEMKKDKYILKSPTQKDKKGKPVRAQASITIMNHKTGEVVAAVGGLGDQVQITKGDWNRTTRTTRQLGSSMKPIGVVAPGLETGALTAASVYDDSPFQGFNNYDHSHRGFMNIRKGIEVSNNIIFLKAVHEVGEEKSANFLRSVGFKIVDDDLNPASLALGGLTYGVTTTQVAGAYSAIANGGQFIKPRFISRVENSRGEEIYKPEIVKNRVLSPQNAFILQKIMTSTVVGAEGTGGYCRVRGFETAVKTGTSNDEHDKWMCGFTPKYTAAAWFGYDKEEKLRWYGINPAGLIWSGVMRAIHEGLKGEDFKRPDGIVEVAVCRDSGKRPSKLCSKDQRGNRIYTEYFVEGTQPKETCDVHVEVEVCKKSNKLPTEYCKKEDLVKRVFIKRPNKARTADSKYAVPTEKCTECEKKNKSEFEKNKRLKKEVESMIKALPNVGSLTKADVPAIKAIMDKIEQMTDKSIINKELFEKFKKAKAKLPELDPPEEPPQEGGEGDPSNPGGPGGAQPPQNP